MHERTRTYCECATGMRAKKNRVCTVRARRWASLLAHNSTITSNFDLLTYTL